MPHGEDVCPWIIRRSFSLLVYQWLSYLTARDASCMRHAFLRDGIVTARGCIFLPRRHARCFFLAQATTDTTAAKAAAEAAAIAAAEGTSNDGDTAIKAFELYKLSHNIKKMIGASRLWGFWLASTVFTLVPRQNQRFSSTFHDCSSRGRML